MSHTGLKLDSEPERALSKLQAYGMQSASYDKQDAIGHVAQPAMIEATTQVPTHLVKPMQSIFRPVIFLWDTWS